MDDAPRARRERLVLDGRPCEVVLDPHNRRVKVLDVDAPLFARLEDFLAGLDRSSPAGAFTKLCAYGRGNGIEDWQAHGLRHEAEIRGFYADGASAHLWARYADPSRSEDPDAAAHDRIVADARERAARERPLPEGWRLARAAPDDAARLAACLRETFDAYPTPLDEGTVAQAIASGRSRIHVLEDERGVLAAMASAEIDRDRVNAEITDCVTLPAFRGRGLMVALIRSFDAPLSREEGVRDLYTIARADVVGMNRAFAAAGYAYTGRLVQNCRMPGGFESMNVWCRRNDAE